MYLDLYQPSAFSYRDSWALESPMYGNLSKSAKCQHLSEFPWTLCMCLELYIHSLWSGVIQMMLSSIKRAEEVACLSWCKHVYLFQMSNRFVLCNGLCLRLPAWASDVSNLIVVTPICLPRLSSFRMETVGIRRFWHSRPGWHAPILKHRCHSLPLLLPHSVSLCHTHISNPPPYTHTHTCINEHWHCPTYSPAAFIPTQEQQEQKSPQMRACRRASVQHFHKLNLS